MHYTISHSLKLFLLFLALVLLASCGSMGTPTSKEEAPYYVASVKISSDAEQKAIEAMYGGKAILFNLKAGYAVLGFSKEQGELTSLNTSLNQNALTSPEVNASGISAWSNGHSAWSNGHSTWSSGWSAWSTGNSTTAPPLPSENDEIFEQIKLAKAHKLSKNYGKGIKVAVIDTGIDFNHPMFSGRLAPANEWRDFVDNDAIPQEGSSSGRAYGHGTAVAGIILQVAPLATILPLRVLGSEGEGDLDHVLLAIDWAIRMGADVINVSLGTNEYVEALDEAVRHALEMGIYVIAAAGNTGTRQMIHPAASAKTIHNEYALVSVGSVDKKDGRSNFSAYGEALEYVAPGEKILTAFPDGRVARASGTSFSTPLVSGTLALYMSDASQLVKFLSFDEYLKLGADTSLFSNGRLNVAGGYSFLPLPKALDKDVSLSLSGSWKKSGGISSSSKDNPQYSFEVTASGTVSIDLSSAVDSYLFLLDSSGRVIAEDDDGGSGYNSRIVKYLDQGSYTLVAASYEKKTSAAFSLKVKGQVSELK